MTKPDSLKPIHQRRAFELEGVRFRRVTAFHEPGRYEVEDQEGGRWVVTGDGTNRYPWFIRPANKPHHAEGGAKNLEDAAGWISRYRRRNPLSPYKPEPRSSRV